jgi:UDP-N-acetylmuramoylalanine--D-glutamate ligase
MDHQLHSCSHQHLESEIAMKTKVKNKTFWIAGAAKSGLAVAQLLKNSGANVFVSEAGTLSELARQRLTAMKVPFEEGQHSLEKMLTDADFVVLSPSIRLDQPLPSTARLHGLPVISEIEVASWFLPTSAIVIGVTGTNGKSTTTHYLSQLAQRIGRRAIACGNYGVPLSEAIVSHPEVDCFVVELSSYQLETTHSLKTDISLFLNLQNDHMGRYGHLQEYFKAKWRLIGLTKNEGLAIVEASLIRRALEAGCALPSCQLILSYGFLPCGRTPNTPHNIKPASRDFFATTRSSRRNLPKSSYGHLTKESLAELLVDGFGEAWLERQPSESSQIAVHITDLLPNAEPIRLAIDEPVLDGPHNQTNLLNASVAALAMGAAHDIVVGQWTRKDSQYVHLPHRLEDVCRGQCFVDSQGRSKSIRIINDSKATNVESTLVAVESFSHGVRLLLGGDPKGDAYTMISPSLGHRVVQVYPFGRAGPLIAEQLGSHDCVASPLPNMLEAAQRALDESVDGDTILLSPACASFDEFQNFEHRGDTFRQWAMKQVSSV